MSKAVRRWTALAGLVLLAGTGCSSTSHGNDDPAAACTWPATDTPARDGLALALNDGWRRLLAFDTATGALVGDCSTTSAEGLTTPIAQFTAGGKQVIIRGHEYLMPVVAGTSITAMPDNRTARDASGTHQVEQGGVRELHTGAHHDLAFAGWQVVSVVGSRLLLTQPQPYAGPDTDPQHWCVLPDRSAPRAQCGPVPGATGPGTPYVTPGGTIGWTPLAGRQLAIGAVDGYAAELGTAGIAGWSAPDARGSIVSPDLHTVLFPEGRAGVAAGLAWADVTTTDGRVTAAVHTSAFRGDATYGSLGALRATMAGWFGGPDGASVLLVDQHGLVSRFGAGPVRHRMLRLKVPRGTLLGYLLSWPASTANRT